MQKRSDEPTYKTNKKNKAKRLRVITFSIANTYIIAILLWGAIQKSNIVIMGQN